MATNLTPPPDPSGSHTDHNLLVDVHALGTAVFGDNAPSERTLRSLTRQGVLPHFRIGKLIRYDARLVRSALESKCLVHGKKRAGRNLS